MSNVKDFEGTGTQLYSSFIHKSRYARWLDDEERRETWDETVDRYINFFVKRFPEHEKEIRELRSYIHGCHVMPSMRTLMTAGPALETSELANYNCSYLPIDHQRAFDELFFILLNGVGVGYSVERQYTNKLPEIPEKLYPTDTVIVVADSKLGWAKALKELVSLLYSGHIPTWDVSLVRPAGSRLKTFGGRASGEGPLLELFSFFVATFKKAAGRKLNSVECHDLCCKIAEVTVVGGVRRSSLISLSNPSDDRMRTAKSGQWWQTDVHRAMANNSACYTEKPDFSTFLKEWHSLYESKSGERGFFSRAAAKRQAAKSGRRDTEFQYGCNPCQVGKTLLLTTCGFKKIEDLANTGDGTFRIINWQGQEADGRAWYTGDKETVKISFHRTHGVTESLEFTPNHIFMTTEGLEVEAANLVGHRIMPYIDIKGEFERDDVFAGFIQGDGVTTDLVNYNKKTLMVCIGDKDNDVADFLGLTFQSKKHQLESKEARDIAERYQLVPKHLPERELPPGPITDDFLTGLYSANGSVIKGHRVAFKTTCYALAEGLKAELEARGMSPYITTNKPSTIKWHNGTYTSKQSYDVNLTRYVDIRTFAKRISFIQQYKKDDLEALILAKAPKVQSVKSAGVQPVYDFTEPLTHWGVVAAEPQVPVIAHNCSEILLRPNGLCNLSEVIVRHDDTMEQLKDKVRVATILGTLQATLTNFKYLRPVWKRNAEEEALLGVSMTGIMDHKLLNDPNDEGLPHRLEEMKKVYIETNKAWAAKLGINVSAAIGTTKPSGCRPSDAITITSKGILTLDELIADYGVVDTWNKVTDLDVQQDNGNTNKVSKLFVNGKAPVVRITTSYNLGVESTRNHQWFVKQRYLRNGGKYVDVNEWVAAEDIKVGDILDVNMNVYNNTEEADLISSDTAHDERSIDVNTPTKMTPELAWLIGYFYGNGCLSEAKRRVRFIGQRKDILDKVQSTMLSVFGLHSEVHRCNDRDAYTYEKGSVQLYEWFKLNGFSKERMEIPRKIRESSKESVVSFMAGLLDADGCVSTREGRSTYIYTTRYDEFAEQLQHVAWSVGMGIGRSLNSKGKNFQTNKHIWLLSSCHYQDPNTIDLLAKYSVKAANVTDWQFFTSTARNLRILGKVTNVEDVGEKDTYDIEVENEHWYWAGSIKSHNTVSQLCNTASGIHPRFAKYYIRRVRADVKDPLAQFMKEAGFPNELDVTNNSNIIFSFPIESPEGSILADDVSALDQLKLSKIYQDHWTEHKVSQTVYYSDDEFLEIGSWLWKNFDDVSGVSFLPRSDHNYRQAPYEAIDKETYERLAKEIPKDIDWEALALYELEDSTTGTQELACTGGVCDISTFGNTN